MNAHEAALEARRSAIWARRPEVRTLELVGPDRVRFLNGQLTNDVSTLKPGEGCLAVKTSAKGRCEAFVRVRATERALYIDLRDVVAASVLASLARYIIMDDCEISDVSSTREVFTVLGPSARVEGAPELAPHASTRVGELVVIRDETLGIAGYEIHAPPGHTPRFDALEAPVEALEILRIEEGIPLDGRELGPDVIPLEANLERAISMTKGCYSGQEVIARATNLGGVQWKLVTLSIDGEAKVGDELRLDGDKVQGSITSLSYSPREGRTIALGFVRRASAAPSTKLEAPHAVAVVLR